MTVVPEVPMPEAHWAAWLDYSCRCGLPHPKPGKFGPPPTTVEIDGTVVEYPPYPGVMGGERPWRES